jgi:chromosomal replication initiator protein
MNLNGGLYVTVGTSLGDIGMPLVDRMTQSLGNRNVNLYFQSTRLEEQDGQLCLYTPNRFVKEWIERHFSEQLNHVASEHLMRTVQVDVRIDSPRPATPSGIQPEDRPVGKPRASQATSPAVNAQLRYDLDDFVVGQANLLAHRSAVELIQPGVRSFNPLVIHGGCGLGKTHLIQGACRRFAQLNPQLRWRYMTAEQFTNQYIDAVRHQRLTGFRKRVRGVDLLVIDDVQFFAGKTGTQTELQHTIDALVLNGGKLILAADSHPHRVEQLSPGLASRMVSGMVAKIETPDRQMLPRLVQVLAERRGLKMLACAVQYLAERLGGSVRELEGVLTRLQALMLLDDSTHPTDQPIGYALLNQVLWKRPSAMERRPVRFNMIIDVICRELCVTREQVLSTSRQRQVVLARSLLIHLAREMTSLSYPELARQLGRTNHSTVITADQRIRKQVRQRCEVRLQPDLTTTTVDQLLDRLRESVGRAVDQAA